jgi:hypothetical protein
MISDLEVPGELPETAAAWRAQQARWTKGHAQVARKLLPAIWQSNRPLWERAAMTLQICQFAFYSLALASVVINLSLLAIGADYLHTVVELGWAVTVLGLLGSVTYLASGQYLLGRKDEPSFGRALLLAIVFPSGLILSNTRATFDAFATRNTVFAWVPTTSAAYSRAWRGRPELATGLLLPLLAFAEQAWSAPFFAFAAAGLLSIGAMGWTGTGQVPARDTRLPIATRTD